MDSQLASCPSLFFQFFDGSQDWVIHDKDAVAGSSPAFGSKCRSSSVVEHVNSQFVSYPSQWPCASTFRWAEVMGYRQSLVRLQSAPPNGAVAQWQSSLRKE